MERKSTRTKRGKTSHAFGGIKGDSDSNDSQAQKELSGANSAWESNNEKDGKKKKKKYKNSFSKGFLELMNLGDNSSNNTNGTSTSPKHYRTVSNRVSKTASEEAWTSFETTRTKYDILHEQEEQEDDIPKLPRGKIMVDTVVATDVDSLYDSVFETGTFFEIVGTKAYEEFKNYRCSHWFANRSSGLLERHMKYEMTKTIAFSRQNVFVDQTQILLGYSSKGLIYGVDTITQNSGVIYSDYFRLNIHYRFQKVSETHSKLIVIADIEFVKPCLFKGRIESEAWSGLKKYYDVVTHEVKPEKDFPVEDLMDFPDGVSKYSKEGQLRKKIVDARLTGPQDRQGSMTSSVFSQEVLLMAFLMIILVLVMLTTALFKMQATIAHLDDRLQRIEHVLERNGRFLDIILNEDFSNKAPGHH